MEAAYARQPAQTKRVMRSDMLRFYVALNASDAARRFVTSAEMKNPENALFIMDLLLENDRMKEAKRLANQCEGWLEQGTTTFLASLLIETLAAYHARTGKWDAAAYYWRQAPIEEPLRQSALSGLVEIRLGQALLAVRDGLEKIDQLKRNPASDRDITLHGNEEALTSDAERALLRFKRGIERLMPKFRRKAFGIEEAPQVQ